MHAKRMARSSSAPLVGVVWWFIFAIALLHLVGCEEFYYDPPCSKGCSETIHSSDIEYYNYAHGSPESGVCDNELTALQDIEINSQSPFMDVTIDDYSTLFHDNSSSGKYEVYVGNWTGVNITYKFNPDVAGLVYGVAFSIRSVSPDNDTPYFSCRGYKFSTPLSIEDIQDDRGNQYTHFFDCLRGQIPGYEYEYTIHLISNSTYGNQVYKFYYRSPACSFKPTDMLCQKEYDYDPADSTELPRLWKPQYFEAQAVDYEEVMVEIEVAPVEYAFNEFKVSIADTERQQKVYVSSAEIQEKLYFGRSVRYIQVNLTAVLADKDGEEISVQLTPVPFPNSCMDSDGRSQPCSTTQSRYFTVYANPCDTEHCGKHEVCKALSPGQGHQCVCEEGYIPIEGTDQGTDCIKDECSPTNPCGQGQCVMTTDGYTCHCNDGYINHGGTCKRDPCLSNPCQPYGDCLLNLRSSSLSYSCDCIDYYVFNTTTCIEDICETSNPCGPNGKTCQVLSDPLCTCKHNYVYKKGKGCVVSPGILSAIIIGCFAMIGIVCLVFYCSRNADWKKYYEEIQEWIRSKSECPQCGTKIAIAWKRGSPKVYQPVRQSSANLYTLFDSSRSSTISSRDMEMGSAPNDRVGPHGTRPGTSLISRELIMNWNTTQLLILSANDNPQHTQVIEALANFLQMDKNNFSVVLPSWDQLDIAANGWETWFYNKLNWADKVILVASEETRRMVNGHYRSCDKNFVKAINHITEQYGPHSENDITRKFQVVYFEYSDANRDIPSSLKHLPRYKLMKHMEALFFKLHNIEQYKSGRDREVSWMKEDHYHKGCTEGLYLYNAIQNIKNEIKLCTYNNNEENTSEDANQLRLTQLPVNPHPHTHIPRGINTGQGLQFDPLPQDILETDENPYQDDEQYLQQNLLKGHSNEQIADGVSESSSSSQFDDAFVEVAEKNPHDVDLDSNYSSRSGSSITGFHQPNVYSSNGCVVLDNESLQRMDVIS